jgi:hypothetical protein
MAARAAVNPTITGRFNSVMVLAPSTGNQAAYQGRQRRAPRLTATQRDSQGRISAWARSPYAPKGGWR